MLSAIRGWSAHWLVRWTRDGLGRHVFVGVSRRSQTVREALFQFDMRAALYEDQVPGRYVIEWQNEWSAQMMTQILVEKIRHAPRPERVTGYLLRTVSTTITGLAEDTNLEQAVGTFLDGLGAERQMVLLLRGEFVAATLQRNHWVGWERGRG